MRKLSVQKEKAMRDAFVKYPIKSDNDIAKIVKISQPTVSKYRKEHALAIDAEFIAIVAGKFIKEYGDAVDHWKVLIGELETLKSTQELDAMEKLQLVREQANLRARILFLASQGEVREVIKVMRSGKFTATS